MPRTFAQLEASCHRRWTVTVGAEPDVYYVAAQSPHWSNPRSRSSTNHAATSEGSIDDARPPEGHDKPDPGLVEVSDEALAETAGMTPEELAAIGLGLATGRALVHRASRAGDHAGLV